MSAIETFEHKGHTIRVYVDEEPEDPREHNNIAKMYCQHKRYTLGDKHSYKAQDFNTWDEFKVELESAYDIAFLVPLYLLDHGTLTMSTEPFSCPYDSGQVGFMFITTAATIAEWSKSGLTPSMVSEMATMQMKAEVGYYSKYLSGNIYGYRIHDDDDEEVDSVWGIADLEECKDYARQVCPELPLYLTSKCHRSAGEGEAHEATEALA